MVWRFSMTLCRMRLISQHRSYVMRLSWRRAGAHAVLKLGVTKLTWVIFRLRLPLQRSSHKSRWCSEKWIEILPIKQLSIAVHILCSTYKNTISFGPSGWILSLVGSVAVTGGCNKAENHGTSFKKRIQSHKTEWQSENLQAQIWNLLRIICASGIRTTVFTTKLFNISPDFGSEQWRRLSAVCIRIGNFLDYNLERQNYHLPFYYLWSISN